MNNRERIIDISKRHKLSHIGSCLTALDIIEEIYGNKKPEDKVILDSGHAHLAHLVVRGAGRSTEDIIKSIEELGIHCDRRSECDVSTGSLGQGLPIAVGIALADRSKSVFVLTTDGAMAEGSNWEALRIAKEQKLDNLKVYVNCNGWGAYQAIDTDDLEKRIKAFGFPVDIRRTNSDIGTWAVGLQSHYKVADEELK